MNIRKAEPAAVYHCYDKDGRALYVGSSYNPEKRLREHRHAAWYPLMATCLMDWYPDRMLAFGMELEAIRAEQPLGNRAGKNSPQPARTKTVGRGTAGGSA